MFTTDKFIGSVLKINVLDGLQEYLGEALSKCNISHKIGATPILVNFIINILNTKYNF